MYPLFGPVEVPYLTSQFGGLNPPQTPSMSHRRYGKRGPRGARRGAGGNDARGPRDPRQRNGNRAVRGSNKSSPCLSRPPLKRHQTALGTQIIWSLGVAGPGHKSGRHPPGSLGTLPDRSAPSRITRHPPASPGTLPHRPAPSRIARHPPGSLGTLPHRSAPSRIARHPPASHGTLPDRSGIPRTVRQGSTWRGRDTHTVQAGPQGAVTDCSCSSATRPPASGLLVHFRALGLRFGSAPMHCSMPPSVIPACNRVLYVAPPPFAISPLLSGVC